MKKKSLIITGAILLLSLLIPIFQIPFIFILESLFIATITFLLITIIGKKPFYPAPNFFSILLIAIVGLELHFTRNLIIGWDYIVFGELIARFNYIIGLIIIGVIALFNLFFIAHFIFKETINFDSEFNINSKFLEISQDISLTPKEIEDKKNDAIKMANFCSNLQQAHKTLMYICLITIMFAIAQVIICFFKKNIVWEPTVGNVVGFNFIIFITITMLAISVYKASKKH